MGADCFSASSTERVGRYSPHRTMYKYLGVLIACGVAQAAPGYGHAGHYHQQSQCTTEYDIKLDTACQTYYDQACHEEYDVVVDTTYVEECQDIVTQHCQETSQQVHHSSAVVGHDSQVVSHGHVGYHKREAEAKAEAEPGYGHKQHNNKQCFSKPHKQCHQKPVHNQRQECHEEYDVIVDTTYIEECQDIITTHCEETSQQVHHSSAVVGHDSQVVAHGHTGYGYGKREAEAEPGYSTGPKCHDKKDRQCHKKPVQNERKVPRPVCKTVVDTTYIEECEETFTTQCHTAVTQVHHSSAVVGHDTQVVAHTHGHAGYKKREADADAEPGYGYSSGPQCHAKKDRQCHKKPVQSSHKVPRQVCVPVAREECHPVEVKVPRQVCNNFGYAVEDQSYGHGYGYGH